MSRRDLNRIEWLKHASKNMSAQIPSALTPRTKPNAVFSLDDVASKHGPASETPYIVVDGNVLDISQFEHPAGRSILMERAGTDATDVFFRLHRSKTLASRLKSLKVGVLRGKWTSETSAATLTNGVTTRIPFAEPFFFRGLPSPFYDAGDVSFREHLRVFFNDLRVEAEAHERSGDEVSDELYARLGESGVLGCFGGPGGHLRHARRLPGDITELTWRRTVLVFQERARLWTPGFEEGISSGINIALPAIMKFGPSWMREDVAKEIVRGVSRVALAITEPGAGSDVAGITTRADLTSDGQNYKVNGVKKWITGGHSADYFVTAVRTGGEGKDGISLLLIPRCAGVVTSKIETLYSGSASTALVVFENAVVPTRNLIGVENRGFKLIMYNFNAERLVISAIAIARCRMLVEECFKWTINRLAFGKRLVDNPVVALELAEMCSAVEAANGMLEQIVYAMDSMPYDLVSTRLGSSIALLKFNATRACGVVADKGANLFGGRAVTTSGLGFKMAIFLRVHKYAAIYGGSESVMGIQAVKMAARTVTSRARADLRGRGLLARGAPRIDLAARLEDRVVDI